MTLAQKQVLESRIKSFLWRLGSFLVIAGLNWISKDITNSGLDPAWVTIIGLAAGELTKFLNTNLPWLKTQIN